MTEGENPCLPWTKVKQKVKNYNQDKWELGNHNYCRNPGEGKDREYCYVSLKKWEYCATKTCSKLTNDSFMLNIRYFNNRILVREGNFTHENLFKK